MINLFLFLSCSIILVHEGIWKIFICILMEVGIVHTFLVFKDFLSYLVDYPAPVNSFTELGIIKLSFQILGIENNRTQEFRSVTIKKFSLPLCYPHHSSHHVSSAYYVSGTSINVCYMLFCLIFMTTLNQAFILHTRKLTKG